MKINNKCPSCNNNEISEKFKVNDNLILRCEFCGLEFIKNYYVTNKYTKEYYFTKKNDYLGYSNYLNMGESLKKEAGFRLNVIQQYVKKGKLLDIGAGDGTFLTLARKRNFIVFSNEMSEYAIELLKTQGYKVYAGKIGKIILPKKSFDIITAWDVLEHIAQINQAILEIRNALKPGGYFIFTTPSTDSYDATLLRHHWYGYKKAPEHVIYFNNRSIRFILEKHDFDVIEIRKWGFVRSLDFIFSKLAIRLPGLRNFNKLFKMIGISNLSFFIPGIDFLVVAKLK
jgi:2-polyprenyl-3-methyl-5-hydroxy-6-metoxy-1,4-benzoquinol methylase